MPNIVRLQSEVRSIVRRACVNLLKTDRRVLIAIRAFVTIIAARWLGAPPERRTRRRGCRSPRSFVDRTLPLTRFVVLNLKHFFKLSGHELGYLLF